MPPIERQRAIADQQKYEADRQRGEALSQTNKVKEQVGKIQWLQDQLGSKSDAEIKKLQEWAQRRQSIRITYYFKPEDGDKVVKALQSQGFRVNAQESQVALPTNAVWWGEGIELKDVQAIAYTLIQNGIAIRYVGKSERQPGRIQIGGDDTVLEDPLWTVERVKSLKSLPEKNQQQP